MYVGRCAGDLPFALVHPPNPSHLAVHFRLTGIDGSHRPPCHAAIPIAFSLSEVQAGDGWQGGVRLGHLFPGYPSSGALCCLHRVQQSQNPYQTDLFGRLNSGYSAFPGLLRPKSDIRNPNLSGVSYQNPMIEESKDTFTIFNAKT